MRNPTECLQILGKLAEEGRLSKTTLADSLADDARSTFLDRCSDIEKRFTKACTDRNDPCLSSGCALEGEVCLEALKNAETDFQKACGEEWRVLFADPANRITVWRT